VHINPFNLRRVLAIGLCWLIAMPYANQLRTELPPMQGFAAFVAVVVAAAFITSKIEVERPAASGRE
jgi:hypothetical protein